MNPNSGALKVIKKIIKKMKEQAVGDSHTNLKVIYEKNIRVLARK
jgi:hypothetical protein